MSTIDNRGHCRHCWEHCDGGRADRAAAITGILKLHEDDNMTFWREGCCPSCVTEMRIMSLLSQRQSVAAALGYTAHAKECEVILAAIKRGDHRVGAA